MVVTRPNQTKREALFAFGLVWHTFITITKKENDKERCGLGGELVDRLVNIRSVRTNGGGCRFG